LQTVILRLIDVILSPDCVVLSAAKDLLFSLSRWGEDQIPHCVRNDSRRALNGGCDRIERQGEA